MSSGRTEVFREVPDRILEEIAEGEEHLDLLRQTRIRTAVVAPLRARGRTLGAIAIGRWQGPDYNPNEIALLEELAMRAGLAIDNARLYEERSYIARTLQRSLLPPRLPEIPGVETAARYRAAGEGIEVGGDFYDVFETIDARWGVAVGDVCGKGARAAAITSLARHTLRAAAMQERLPSEALLMLNEALRRQEVDTDFCTVAYAHLRPTPDGDVALLLANGGHPPPLLLKAGGDVTPVGRSGTLLGVVPDPHLPDTALTLAPGDALVLYTDGVTEARTPEGMFGSERLEELIRSCAGLGAGAIADVIERAVMDLQNGDARDDIAIVVLKASQTAVDAYANIRSCPRPAPRTRDSVERSRREPADRARGGRGAPRAWSSTTRSGSASSCASRTRAATTAPPCAGSPASASSARTRRRVTSPRPRPRSSGCCASPRPGSRRSSACGCA